MSAFTVDVGSANAGAYAERAAPEAEATQLARTARPFVWIGSVPSREWSDTSCKLREAGLFPVLVESTETALRLMARFRARW